MKSEMELVPCPFCGGKADPAGWLDGKGNRGPECEGCGATAPSVDVWQAANQQVVPSGYVMVPVEPTPEMLEALDEDGDLVADSGEYYFADVADFQSHMRRIYSAMLATAPQAERVLWYRGRKEPQAEQQIVGWINEDELPENYPYDAMFPFSKVDMVRMFPVYAPVAQAEQAVEPVKSADLDLQSAFAKADKEARLNSCPRDIFLFALIQALQDNPLYTAPPAPDVSGLVEALEDIAGTHHHSASAGSYFAQVAREALAAHRSNSHEA